MNNIGHAFDAIMVAALLITLSTKAPTILNYDAHQDCPNGVRYTVEG
jgi:quinol monooxygenase YgiN